MCLCVHAHHHQASTAKSSTHLLHADEAITIIRHVDQGLDGQLQIQRDVCTFVSTFSLFSIYKFVPAHDRFPSLYCSRTQLLSFCVRYIFQQNAVCVPAICRYQSSKRYQSRFEKTVSPEVRKRQHSRPCRIERKEAHEASNVSKIASVLEEWTKRRRSSYPSH